MKHLNGTGTFVALLMFTGWAGVSCSSDTGTITVVAAGTGGGLSGLGTGGSGTGTGGAKGTGTTGTNVSNGGSTSSTTTAAAGGSVAVSTGAGVLCVKDAALVSDFLIDDCEDNNNQLHMGDSRNGYWYTFNDATVGATAQTPPATSVTPMTAPGYDGTGFGFFTTGGGYTTWGSGFGFSFVNGGGTLMCPYNASIAKGVDFYYKSDVGIRLVIRMRSTIPVSAHGDCSQPNSACDNPHGIDLPSAATWTKKAVVWTDLAVQASWGWSTAGVTPPAFDPTAIVDMQVKIPTPGTFNVWIDQIQFTQ